MKIRVKKEVYSKFHPEFRVGFLYIRDIDPKTTLPQSIHLLQDVEKLVHLTFHTSTTKNHDLILPWAVAQAELGKDAHHYHTSVERLLKKVLKGKDVSTNHPVENVARYIALKHIIPHGTDDPMLIEKGITFAVASGKEKVGVLRTLKSGALYYEDAKAPLGTKLDQWKNVRTKLQKGSTSALIHFDALPPINKKQLQKILNEAKSLLKAFCGGEIETFILDINNSSGNLTL